MRKLLLTMVLLLPLLTLEMRADNEKTVIKIPVELEKNIKHNRSLKEDLIVSTYYGMMSAVVTVVNSDLGEVDITVTNCGTGGMWYDSFDSSEETQTILQISGEAGLYEITYTTESGDVYRGLLTIE